MSQLKFENPDVLNQVADFHTMFDHLIKTTPGIPDTETVTLRLNLIAEEYRELYEAIKKEDMVDIADALADLQYVLTGTILSFGLGSKFAAIFNEVQRSNMSKACATEQEAIDTAKANAEECFYIQRLGKFCVRRKSDQKTVKSINYSPANLLSIIKPTQIFVQVEQIWLEYIDMTLLHAWLILRKSEDPAFQWVVLDESGWERNMTEDYLEANCETLEDINVMAYPEEKARVIALQRTHERNKEQALQKLRAENNAIDYDTKS